MQRTNQFFPSTGGRRIRKSLVFRQVVFSNLSQVFSLSQDRQLGRLGQIMIKIAPFGWRHANNNKSLPLVELPRYNEFAQINLRCTALQDLHLKLNSFKSEK